MTTPKRKYTKRQEKLSNPSQGFLSPTASNDPDVLMRLFVAQIRTVKEKFTPEVWTYIVFAFEQILAGRDPKTALGLNVKKRNIEVEVMRLVMLETIKRKTETGMSKKKAIKALADEGFPWDGRVITMEAAAIEKFAYPNKRKNSKPTRA